MFSYKIILIRKAFYHKYLRYFDRSFEIFLLKRNNTSCNIFLWVDIVTNLPTFRQIRLNLKFSFAFVHSAWKLQAMWNRMTVRSSTMTAVTRKSTRSAKPSVPSQSIGASKLETHKKISITVRWYYLSNRHTWLLNFLISPINHRY